MHSKMKDAQPWLALLEQFQEEKWNIGMWNDNRHQILRRMDQSRSTSEWKEIQTRTLFRSEFQAWHTKFRLSVSLSQLEEWIYHHSLNKLTVEWYVTWLTRYHSCRHNIFCIFTKQWQRTRKYDLSS
jgi:hypothetical protein